MSKKNIYNVSGCLHIFASSVFRKLFYILLTRARTLNKTYTETVCLIRLLIHLKQIEEIGFIELMQTYYPCLNEFYKTNLSFYLRHWDSRQFPDRSCYITTATASDRRQQRWRNCGTAGVAKVSVVFIKYRKFHKVNKMKKTGHLWVRLTHQGFRTNL